MGKCWQEKFQTGCAHVSLGLVTSVVIYASDVWGMEVDGESLETQIFCDFPCNHQTPAFVLQGNTQ